MRSSFDLLAVLLSLAAVFGFVNHRLLRLPLTVGLLLIALCGTILAIGLDALLPQLGLREALRGVLAAVDFPTALLQGFLAFLLFAGALEVDLAELFAGTGPVLALASFGTILSTALIAAALYLVAHGLGLALPAPWCLVFGALISPTDPVAVLLVLKRVGMPARLQATIAGESLFNDGIAVVLFSLLLSLASGPGALPYRPWAIAAMFVVQSLGGGLVGLALGWVAFELLRRIDDYNVELIISLALVTGAYSLAGGLGVSGPVAVVVAGLAMGNHGMQRAMSERTRQHLKTFWLLVDDTLNALLFLLIGLEVAAVELQFRLLVATAAMIPIALAVRWLSVAASALPLSLRLPERLGTFAVLTWGGLRGGLSVAMALSLPASTYKPVIVTIAYGIVVFSIVVQGLTLDRVLRRVLPRAEAAP